MPTTREGSRARSTRRLTTTLLSNIKGANKARRSARPSTTRNRRLASTRRTRTQTRQQPQKKKGNQEEPLSPGSPSLQRQELEITSMGMDSDGDDTSFTRGPSKYYDGDRRRPSMPREPRRGCRTFSRYEPPSRRRHEPPLSRERYALQPLGVNRGHSQRRHRAEQRVRQEQTNYRTQQRQSEQEDDRQQRRQYRQAEPRTHRYNTRSNSRKLHRTPRGGRERESGFLSLHDDTRPFF